MRAGARIVWSGLALWLLVGCASMMDASRLSSAPARPPVPADSVRLFFSPDYLTGRYEPVAFLGTDVDWNATFNEGTYRALRARAARLGANAVIVGSIIDANGNPRITGLPPRAMTVNIGRAVAVYLFPSGSPP
jgi:hypothetical protein